MVVKKASYPTRRPLKELIILRYKKQNFLNNFRPRAEEYETTGFTFWHDFRNCIPFVEMKFGSVNTFFSICFRTLSVNFSSVFGKQFCEMVVKYVVFVSRRFLWRDDKFWEIVFLFLSLIAKISDFWHKTFAWF